MPLDVLPATELIDLIAGRETGGHIELRWWGPNHKAPDQEWYLATDSGRRRAAESALHLASKGDVFVGCAPRVHKGHGGKANVEHAWCLWVDCDTPEAAARLAEFTPAPTLTIASGTAGNVHGWWSLETPVPSRWVERANRRLAHLFGADPKCAEVARILRPPGTRNHKHDPAALVEVVGRNPGMVPLRMVADLPDPTPRRPEGLPVVPRADVEDALLGISAQEYVPRLTGRDVDARGFAQCPLHEDWSPSLMCYAEPSRGWHCFQCDTGGTVYDLGAALWNMPTRGAGFIQLKERLARELL